MAVLGLRFCARAFPSCGKRGPLFIAVRGPLTIAASRCRAQAPDAQAQQSWLTGRAAPRHAGSSQTRARTRALCIGRQILNHCATREALSMILNHTTFQLQDGSSLFIFSDSDQLNIFFHNHNTSWAKSSKEKELVSNIPSPLAKLC